VVARLAMIMQARAGATSVVLRQAAAAEHLRVVTMI
jgi:hypothetical protein